MSRKRSVNVVVTLRETKGDQNRLIRKFIKKVKKAKIVEQFRENMFYEKPSAKRRRQKLKKKENARKAQEERNKKLVIK